VSVHLVLAHPLGDSLNAHLAEHIEQALRSAGVAVDRLDLYGEGFQPSLTPDERAQYYAEPRHGDDVVPLQGRLAAAEHLVLVFPTWWFGLPAILKGWIDRVWSPGFAFEQGTPIRPKLTGLKSVLVVTTLGTPWWVEVALLWPVRRVVKIAVIGACAPQAKVTWLSLHEAESVDADRLARFTRRIDRAVARMVENRP
jgi:NAD(P)H dehydrogenase (quinone)